MSNPSTRINVSASPGQVALIDAHAQAHGLSRAAALLDLAGLEKPAHGGIRAGGFVSGNQHSPRAAKRTSRGARLKTK